MQVYHVWDVTVQVYVVERRNTGKTVKALNMGSYNYLGFSETSGSCAVAAEMATRNYGVGVCSTRHELGKCSLTTVLLYGT